MKRPPLKTKPPKSEWKVVFAGFRSKQAKKDERFARQFHSKEFVEWMQAKPCCCGKCAWSTNACRLPEEAFGAKAFSQPFGQQEVHHVVSRGAGGTWKDTVPLSRTCHSEFHQKGRLSFCQARGWPLERLSELAAGYAREWEKIMERSP